MNCCCPHFTAHQILLIKTLKLLYIYFRYEDPMPEPKDIIALLQDFQDDVSLLFAIVLPDTVTFLQFGSVRLPVETVCP